MITEELWAMYSDENWEAGSITAMCAEEDDDGPLILEGDIGQLVAKVVKALACKDGYADLAGFAE